MRSLSLVCLALTLPLPCLSMEWHEVEQMALEERGRVESLFEIAAYGQVTNRTLQSMASYDPELRDGLGRTLKDIARVHQNAEVLYYLESLPEGTLATSSTADTASTAAESTPQPSRPLPESKSSQEDIDRAMSLIAANRSGVIGILLRRGLDPNGFSKSRGRWLLEEAIIAKNDSIVDVLIRAGADVNKLSLTEAQGKTMLMMAAILDEPDIVKLLLENGANHLARGSNGATALHDACYFGATQALPVLLPYYQDENFSPSCSINGYPLNVMLAYPGHDRTEAVIEAFKQAGFHFNDPRYSPPLIVEAFKYRRDHLIRTLLLAGADPTALDVTGKSSFDYLSDEQIILLYEVKEWLDEEASTSQSR